VAVFFCANAYFQIKSNKDITDPDSIEFQNLEKLETDGYENAKKLRQEILHEVSIDWAIVPIGIQSLNCC
jgi:E3 ubiquitin-protein ligase SHPRH